MRVLSLSLFFIIMYIFQASFFTHLSFFGARPDLFTGVVVAVGIVAGAFEGLKAGLVGGLILDLLRGTFLGLSIPGKMLIGLLVGLLPRRIYADRWVIPIVASFGAAIFDQSFFLILGNSFGLDQPFWPSIRRLVLASAAYTALLAPVINFAVRHLYQEFLKRGWFKEQRLL